MATFAIWEPRPVFVTSTFRDFHAERDHLREHVFPALEERLRERFRYFEPIDLRLGVKTEEAQDPAARELLILKVCLGEIERSRPFLIGLIGDRYGWVPPRDRMEAAAREANWHGDLTGRSVTALEIEYGVLANPDQRKRSRFYLRDPLPYATMPPEIAADYSEAHAGEADADNRVERLDALKQLIKDKLPGRIRSYPATWDNTTHRVNGLEEWGRQVIEDLWEDLESETRDAIAGPAATWQEQEARLVEQFVATACRDFVGRAEILGRLITLALDPAREGDIRGACVVGPPGSGKSSLFSELRRKLSDKGAVLLTHAAGIGPRAGDLDSVLRRFCFELAGALGIADPSKGLTARDALKETFSQLLARASAERRVVCLIDALNQFERSPDGMHATWLPERWPDNARLIATAIPGTESDALGRRTWIRTDPLPPLTRPEAEGIARKVAERRHADIRPEVLGILSSKPLDDGAPAAGNPLWLELALEEVVLLDADDFARMGREFPGAPEAQLNALRIAVASELPPDVERLYAFLLEHTEEVHGAGLARGFANLIAASRSGWRESDLRALLPMRTGEAWDDLRFAALRRGFRAHVVRRGAYGQWDFAHAQMREAVRRRHLADEGTLGPLHAAIANHLESLPSEDALRQSELMRHLVLSGDFTRAGIYYASVFSEAELKGATLGLAGEILVVGNAGYATSLLRAQGLWPSTVATLCRRLVFHLNDTLENPTALSLRLDVLRAAENSLNVLAASDRGNAGWQRDLSVSHLTVGDVLVAQGNLSEALEAFRKSWEISERLATSDPRNAGWQRDLSASRQRIGDVLVAQGNLSEALEAFRKLLEISERFAMSDPGNTGWQRDLSVCHSKVGDVLVARGNLSWALEAFRTSLAISERLATSDRGNAVWQRDLSASQCRIGDALVAQGNRSGALEAFRTSLEISERLAASDPGNAGWQRDVAVGHEKIGTALVAQGDLSGALEAFRRLSEISERLATSDPGNAGWQNDLSFAHEKIGDVLLAQESLPAAFEAHRKSFEIRERLATLDRGNTGWQRDLLASHARIGDVLLAQGDLPGALTAFRKSLEISERLAMSDRGNTGWQRDLSANHSRIGDVLVAQGDDPGALEAFRKSLEIIKRLATSDHGNAGWQRDLSAVHGKIGDVLEAQGNLPGALEAYAAFRDGMARLATSDHGNSGWQLDLATSHGMIGNVLLAQGNLYGALEAFRKSLEIRERVATSDCGNAGWQMDLSICHQRIGDVLTAQGDLAGAASEYRKHLEISIRLATSDSGNTEWQRDLSISHSKLGDVLVAQGVLPLALGAFRKSLEISERLATSDSGNAGWQMDLLICHERIGDVLTAQGDLRGAEGEYQKRLEISTRLATSDSGNAEWQRALSVSHLMVGNVLVAQGNLTDALEAFRKSLEISERLATSDPGNAEWQRDLVVSNHSLIGAYQQQGDETQARSHFGRCSTVLHRMRRFGMHLDPPLAQFLAQLEQAGIEPEAE